MKQFITPCFWFTNNASDAVDFYCSVFNDATVINTSPVMIDFSLQGFRLLALNGGEKYEVNPSISLYVYCGNESEVDRLFSELKEGGEVLIPPGKYDWSDRYAWVQDRYGVNWQLDKDTINSGQKIVPSLLFANKNALRVREALEHYTTVFDTRFLVESNYPEGAGVPQQTLLFAQISCDGTLLNIMSSTLAHSFNFTPGNSLVITCKDQNEIDRYWNGLLQGGGKEDMCGWLTDPFGISWQVVPEVLGKLMTDPEKSDRVVAAFLKMKKMNLEELLNA